MSIHYETALTIATKIRTGETSSVEVTETMLGRIAEVDPTLKAFVTILEEAALAAARKADEELKAGNVRSELHGVPIAVKDLFDTAGIETTYGTKIYRNNVPETDATVIARLKDAGTILLGKLKLTEGAYAQHHPEVDPPLNPWNHDLWCGASSSGSGVAVASGLCFAALGSDTGGSIRFPSAANGIVGCVQTYGQRDRQIHFG